jgi:hypothetical protein
VKVCDEEIKILYILIDAEFNSNGLRYKVRLTVLLFFLFIITMNCNRGPAEDRGKKGCEDAKLFFLLSYSIANDKNIPDDSSIKRIASRGLFFQTYFIDSECDSTKRDSTVDRYYRGYINGKD